MTLRDIVHGIGEAIGDIARTIYTTDIENIAIGLFFIVVVISILFFMALIATRYKTWIQSKRNEDGRYPWYYEELGFVVFIAFILCMLAYMFIADYSSRM